MAVTITKFDKGPISDQELMAMQMGLMNSWWARETGAAALTHSMALDVSVLFPVGTTTLVITFMAVIRPDLATSTLLEDLLCRVTQNSVVLGEIQAAGASGINNPFPFTGKGYLVPPIDVTGLGAAKDLTLDWYYQGISNTPAYQVGGFYLTS